MKSNEFVRAFCSLLRGKVACTDQELIQMGHSVKLNGMQACTVFSRLLKLFKIFYFLQIHTLLMTWYDVHEARTCKQTI